MEGRIGGNSDLSARGEKVRVTLGSEGHTGAVRDTLGQ